MTVTIEYLREAFRRAMMTNELSDILAFASLVSQYVIQIDVEVDNLTVATNNILMGYTGDEGHEDARVYMREISNLFRL